MLGALRMKSPMVALKLNLYVFKSAFMRMLLKIRLFINFIKLTQPCLPLLMIQLPCNPLIPIIPTHKPTDQNQTIIFSQNKENQSSNEPKLNLPQQRLHNLWKMPEQGQCILNSGYDKYQSNVASGKVKHQSSLSFHENKSGVQIVGMQVQKPILSAKDIWANYDPLKPQIRSRQKFIALNQDFKFKCTITLDHKKNILMQTGELVFNNGSSVPVSSAYICYFNTQLNQKGDHSSPRVAYSVDLSSQALSFSSKVNGVKSQQKADYLVLQIQKNVHSRKETIINLLAVIGVQMDCENTIMRKILKCKKTLNNKIDQLFKNPQSEGKPIPHEDIESQPLTYEQSAPQKDLRPIIYFGEGTNNRIDKSLTQQTLEGNKIKIQGGYFIIQSFNYNISLNGEPPVTKTLCRKTLRERRQLDPRTREQNQLKMHRQLQIISTIRNKEYLIQYYCQKNPDNLDYLLMEQYNSSLQQYIYYFGDALCITHKLNIARQLVQAVINLHDSGVIHRDLKPSNILLKDSKDNVSGYSIKIIDYAESYSDKIKDYGTEYACSYPYSPIECGVSRSNTDSKEGIQRYEIDYWSVGITLYQVFFRKLPVSFSRAFLTDIKLSWKNELILVINQRQKYGMALVEDIITIICIKMMKMDQKKRMNLRMAKRILEIVNEYVINLMSLI